MSQNISSFFALTKNEKLTQKEKSKLNLPRYYSKKGLCPVIFTSQALYKKTFQQDGLIHLSGTDLKFKSSKIKTIEDFNQLLQQIRIIPVNKNHKAKELNDLHDDSPFIVEIVYNPPKLKENKSNQSIIKTDKQIDINLNQFQFASIDQNLDNLAIACYNNQSFLYSLKPLKSKNHFWNKKTAKLQSKIDNLKNKLKWLKESVKTFSVFQSIFDNQNSKPLKSFLTQETYQILLQQSYQETLLFIQQIEIGIEKLINKKKKLTKKRNQYVDNYVHQLSRQLINHLSNIGVNNIIYGKNMNSKKEINLGKKNNQQFVNIPFNQIIDKISYKARLANINFMTIEESYTSKTSFLDKEMLLSYKNKKKKDEKEAFLGKRIERGLFKSAKGKVIHADINAAYNITRKVIGEEIYNIVNLRTIMASCAFKFKIKLN